MGLYQRFGSNPGSVVPATVIPIDTIPVAAGQVRITDFGVCSSLSSFDSVCFIELSNDGFVGSIVEVSRIEIPSSGTVFKTFGRPIRVVPGQSVRARFSQGVAGTIAAELFGETATEVDIADI